MAESLEPSGEMLGADAGLHANEARRQVAQPRFEPAAREHLAQYDAAAPIEDDEVEGVLAEVDADERLLLERNG